MNKIMRYKIKDTQFADRYFAEGKIFNSLKEVCEQLISYHSIDCDMKVEQKLLDEGKVDECWNELSYFEWELKQLNILTNKIMKKDVYTIQREHFGHKELLKNGIVILSPTTKEMAEKYLKEIGEQLTIN